MIPASGKVGLSLYLRTVLEHGFFIADPHPGNIFVLPGAFKKSVL